MNKLKIGVRDFLKNLLGKFLRRKSLFTKANTLLIVRLDGIGDYVLFRNFIRIIKESEKFRNYKITLLGNKIWKDLAEEFDKDFIDNFIWIDTVKFWKKSEWIYTYSNLLELHGRGFEMLIIPNDTKTWRSEFIAGYSGAKDIVIGEIDTIFSRTHRARKDINSKEESNVQDQKSIFQFYRNRMFAESLTGKRILIQKPFFENISREEKKEDYIVIFPGASDDKKKWPAENFARVCREISELSKTKIVICGNQTDKTTARKIIETSDVSHIEDKTRNGSLVELVEIISNAKLLITNDTCALHMGAALNTKTVCMSNGMHFGRFHPYPEEIADFVTTLYPHELSNESGSIEHLARKYDLDSDHDINNISTEKVLGAVGNIIEQSNHSGNHTSRINSIRTSV